MTYPKEYWVTMVSDVMLIRSVLTAGIMDVVVFKIEISSSVCDPEKKCQLPTLKNNDDLLQEGRKASLDLANLTNIGTTFVLVGFMPSIHTNR